MNAASQFSYVLLLLKNCLHLIDFRCYSEVQSVMRNHEKSRIHAFKVYVSHNIFPYKQISERLFLEE